jgi:SAM-dependent methyltransferase
MEDWNKGWQKARLNYTLGQKRVSSPSFWDTMWKKPARVSENGGDRLQLAISKISVKPSDTILDIGSGPGDLAVPLAKKAMRVTAIDISTVALNHLEERAEKEKLINITSLAKRWEDIELGTDIEQYDIVVASYSLTMLDLAAALSKMNSAANRAVYIFEAAGQKYRHYQELWPLIYGEEFVLSPDYIYIVNVLYQMGIFANVEIFEYELIQKYTTLEEANRQWEKNLYTNNPQTTDIIRDYLDKKLSRDDNGLYMKDIQEMAAIWWNKG